jgi:topoisomerase-4 subunit A
MSEKSTTIAVSGLYQNWFLDYASYVILERAVPAALDGLKPVQRRILHAMEENDDGRLNKVANIIGNTMQYHPHGDAAIYEAIVNLGHKDLLIEKQGNWGDPFTGDSAAAARYIEAKLTKFAKEVAFNAQITNWQLSYDGRKKEPLLLPMKFPLVLAQGAEGIAVGLATKIMPHNFCELIKASIACLKGKSFQIFPDFPSGGFIDVTDYNDGQRGGKMRIRAKIESPDNKRLIIKEIPYGTTATSIKESIEKAVESGKIKVKSIGDNSAKTIEIEVFLAPGASPDVTIDALYAFTECEVTVYPNLCVIHEEKPAFLSVSKLLKISTQNTKDLLKMELEIRRGELKEKLLFSSLEKIFIENRIYRQIEECTTWEDVLLTIDKGLEPFKPNFYREIVQDDILKLTEIKIKRISKYDTFKADELMKAMQAELDEVENNLENLTDYTIRYFEALLKKYGQGRERKTEIRTFDNIKASQVAANNVKLYANFKDGFIGYGLKKEQFICDCSDIDDIIVFLADGKFSIVKIQEKVFVHKNIIHAEVFHKNDERRIFNMIYTDGSSGTTRVKRFNIGGANRDKLYDLTSSGDDNSRVHWLTSNPNGEAEIVTIYLSPNCRAKIKTFEYDFSDIEIKNRNSQGNILTKYPIKKISLKRKGTSTLGAKAIWFDNETGRLNMDEKGILLGKFKDKDLIIAVYSDGTYELTDSSLTHRYEPKQLVHIGKFDAKIPVVVVYQDNKLKGYFSKSFLVETTTLDKKFAFVSDSSQVQVVFAKAAQNVEVMVTEKKPKKQTRINLSQILETKSAKSSGVPLDIKNLDTIAVLDKKSEKGLFE